MATVPQLSDTPTSIAADKLLHNAWSFALNQFRTELSPELYSKLEAVDSADKLVSHLSALNASYQGRKLPRFLRRLDPVIEQLKFFTQSVSIFAQSNPEIAALVWGSVSVLLQVAVRHKAHLEKILDILENIERHLPRVKSFAELFVVSKRIEPAICALYRDLVHFFVQATIFFNRNPIVNILGLNKLRRKDKNFNDDFDRCLDNIKENTRWIDVEANYALHISHQKTTVQGQEDILSRIAAMSIIPSGPVPSDRPHRLIPLIANPSFSGRQNELRCIRDLLLPGKKKKLSIFSIVGEGGVGKSQLALQFAYSHLDDFDAIFWISAENTLKISQGYEEIGLELGLITEGGNQGPLSTIRETTKHWLRTTDKTWLLLFDNLEHISSLDEYWPSGGCGCVIITTQNQNLIQPPVSASLHLRCFTISEAAQYILDNVPSECRGEVDSDVEDATHIALACGGLPLAVAQVVRFVRFLHIPLSDGRAKFSDPAVFVDQGSELNRLNQGDYYHQTGVPLLWEKPLQSLDSSSVDVMRHLAYLDPDSIPEEFFRIIVEKVTNGDLGTDVDVNGQILSLLARSLISRSRKRRTFLMHRLVQETVLHHTTQPERARLFESVLVIVDDLFPDYDDCDLLSGDWPQCKLILPHIIRLSSFFTPSLPPSPSMCLKLGELLERSAWYLQERGARKEARDLLTSALKATHAGLRSSHQADEQASSTQEKNVTECSLTVFQDLKELISAIENSIGVIELGNGNFEHALHHFLEAVARREELGILDRETIYMKRHVGIAYLSMNRLEEAHAACEESRILLESHIRSSGAHDELREDMAKCFGTLSFVLSAKGQLSNAWDIAVKSTELIRQVHSGSSMQIGECLTTLGNIRRLQGRLEEAEAFHIEALDIRLKLCGEHEETALSMQNYAQTLERLQRTEDAVALAEQGVALLRKLPDAKCILARSLFYLSRYQIECKMDNSSQVNMEAAFMLYREHSGTKADGSMLTSHDFDNLLVAYYR